MSGWVWAGEGVWGKEGSVVGVGVYWFTPSSAYYSGSYYCYYFQHIFSLSHHHTHILSLSLSDSYIDLIGMGRGWLRRREGGLRRRSAWCWVESEGYCCSLSPLPSVASTVYKYRKKTVFFMWQFKCRCFSVLPEGLKIFFGMPILAWILLSAVAKLCGCVSLVSVGYCGFILWCDFLLVRSATTVLTVL